MNPSLNLSTVEIMHKAKKMKSLRSKLTVLCTSLMGILPWTIMARQTRLANLVVVESTTEEAQEEVATPEATTMMLQSDCPTLRVIERNHEKYFKRNESPNQCVPFRKREKRMREHHKPRINVVH